MAAQPESGPDSEDARLIADAAYVAEWFLELEELPPDEQAEHWQALDSLITPCSPDRLMAWVYRFLTTVNRKRAEAAASADTEDDLEVHVAFCNPGATEPNEQDMAAVESLIAEVRQLERQRLAKEFGTLNQRELGDWLVRTAGLQPVPGTNHRRFMNPVNRQTVGLGRHGRDYDRGNVQSILRQVGLSFRDLPAGK